MCFVFLMVLIIKLMILSVIIITIYYFIFSIDFYKGSRGFLQISKKYIFGCFSMNDVVLFSI